VQKIYYLTDKPGGWKPGTKIIVGKAVKFIISLRIVPINRPEDKWNNLLNGNLRLIVLTTNFKRLHP